MNFLILSCLFLQTVYGFKSYTAKIPNGNGFEFYEGIGHVRFFLYCIHYNMYKVSRTGKGTLNSFGKGFKENDKVYDKAFCEMDSDGDGVSNGKELGDPCCTWTSENKITLITEGISHPGNKSEVTTNDKLLNAECAGDKSDTSGSTRMMNGASVLLLMMVWTLVFL